MTSIVVTGDDRAMLQRWANALRTDGRDCTLLSPAAFLGGLRVRADICLFDLGPTGNADPGLLLEGLYEFGQTHFIAMSATPNAGEGLKLLHSGARGYCNRQASAKVLSALLSTVESGEIWAGKQVTDHLLQALPAHEPDSSSLQTADFSGLTSREMEIANAVAEGLSNKVIAADANISQQTVKAHMNSIFRKTGLRNRVQLALAVTQRKEHRRRQSFSA